MTTKQTLVKIKEMQKDVNKFVLKESEMLLNSGGVDKEAFSNDYILPKIILSEVLERAARSYSPFSCKAFPLEKKTAQNIKHF